MNQTEKSKITHNELLKAAHSLFIEQGFNHTTITDIVTRAGYSTGIFYKHYKTKTDILVELWTNYIESSCLKSIVRIQETNATLEETLSSILISVKKFRANPIYKYYAEALIENDINEIEAKLADAQNEYEKIKNRDNILRKENPSASEIRLNTYASAIHSIINAVAESNYSNLDYDFDETTTLEILISIAKEI